MPANSLARLAQDTFVAPSAACVSVAQDRMVEKRFFIGCAEQSGVLPAPHQLIVDAAGIDALPDALFPGILKTVRMGYDGKGQVRVEEPRRRARCVRRHGRRALRAGKNAAAGL